MNDMDNDETQTGEFTPRITGSRLGISPVSVGFNGLPFKTIVLLLNSPFSGVR